jgi:potassium-transporting ATPase KdpC subunit
MRSLIITVKIFLFFTVLTGVIYPLLVTGIAQLAFPFKANGSMIIHDQKAIGSEWIGQQFDSAIYFMSRPSTVSYNPMPSSGSNDGLTSSKLKEVVATRNRHFIKMNHLDSLTVVPPEMLFASASGLDPHISLQSAMLQAERVSGSRNFNPAQKQKLIQCIRDLTEPPQLLILGEERVNVLLLNLETDGIK